MYIYFYSKWLNPINIMSLSVLVCSVSAICNFSDLLLKVTCNWVISINVPEALYGCTFFQKRTNEYYKPHISIVFYFYKCLAIENHQSLHVFCILAESTRFLYLWSMFFIKTRSIFFPRSYKCYKTYKFICGGNKFTKKITSERNDSMTTCV